MSGPTRVDVWGAGQMTGAGIDGKPMADDRFRYDLRAQKALRGIVREVLGEVADTGLPGEHLLYITFNTLADGVEMTERLKKLHPNEMTVVLQHQFWNLKVSKSAFEVSLSFNDTPEHLVIPFQAIKGFFDPSVQFGLQFEAQDSEPAPVVAEAPEGNEVEPESSAPTVPSVPAPAAPAIVGEAEAKPAGAAKTSPPTLAKPKAANQSAEVVQLDTFRKKS